MTEGAFIPTAAFIEYFVLEEALERDVSLSVASRSINPKFGLSESLIFPLRETRLLSLLYCLLVYPAEVWNCNGLIDIVIERAGKDLQLNEMNRPLLTVEAVRQIRNAVAHARVDFMGEQVRFTNMRPDGTINFDKSLTYPDVMNLILVLGRAFHKSAQVQSAIAEAGRKPQ